ncbi:MAG TPA: YdhR family protein [Phenylobacterium sp.]|jgi:hypothetical protein
MPVLLTVSYRVSGNLDGFRAKAAEVAARIAGAAGLRWKIWGLGADGTGLSAYLFETAEAADAFAGGPVIAGLKANPAVQDVSLTSAPVDTTLSQVTHAAFAA